MKAIFQDVKEFYKFREIPVGIVRGAKFCPSGECPAPIDAFQQDILENLRAWAFAGDTVAYVTADFLYLFELVENVVHAARYSLDGSQKRVDDWVDSALVKTGKSYLLSHIDKRVSFFSPMTVH